MVQLMLLKGADKDAFDDQEWTPLGLAAYQGYLAAALALLAAGADVRLRCGEFQYPVVHAAAHQGHVEILRALIEHGADVDAVNSRRSTALHEAACYNQTEATK